MVIYLSPVHNVCGHNHAPPVFQLIVAEFDPVSEQVIAILTLGRKKFNSYVPKVIEVKSGVWSPCTK